MIIKIYLMFRATFIKLGHSKDYKAVYSNVPNWFMNPPQGGRSKEEFISLYAA
jgi:hypothetical protein